MDLKITTFWCRIIMRSKFVFLSYVYNFSDQWKCFFEIAMRITSSLFWRKVEDICWQNRTTINFAITEQSIFLSWPKILRFVMFCQLILCRWEFVKLEKKHQMMKFGRNLRTPSNTALIWAVDEKETLLWWCLFLHVTLAVSWWSNV